MMTNKRSNYIELLYVIQQTKFIMIVIIIALVSFNSCSTNDDNPSQSLDLTLIYGQWFDVDLCNTQNNLVLNQDNAYIRVYSGNTCINNDNDTYMRTGNYTISGDNINFNQLTEELIEEGDVITVPVVNDATLLHSKIIELTDIRLVIEFKIRNNVTGEEIFSYWNLEK